MKSIKRRDITLIEIMIVMFLIAIITAAVAINVTGSLDEGRAFKTKTNIETLEGVLNLMVANDSTLQGSITSQWKELIRRSPLISNADQISKDGWGNEYNIYMDDAGVIKAQSRRYDEYTRTHPTLFK